MPWSLKPQKLVHHEQKACLTISPLTLLTLLVVSNSYERYLLNGESGLRAMYMGYIGSWQISWPIGRPAVVEFLGLPPSLRAQSDPFPHFVKRRVDKCLLMLLGMICGGSIDNIGFADEEDDARSVLEFRKGGGTGKSRSYLYYLLGGRQFESDYLLRRGLSQAETPPKEALCLTVPAGLAQHSGSSRSFQERETAPQSFVTIFVPSFEQGKLATALDCLPWSNLSWSIHRGMQTLLLAYGKEVMNEYRPVLARGLEAAAHEQAHELKRRGWNPAFVDNHMAAVAKTSTMQSGGENGDSVRIVTDVALLYSQYKDESRLDETHFWREQLRKRKDSQNAEVKIDLSGDAIVALTKYWVLEWSHELDHRIHEILPHELLVK